MDQWQMVRSVLGPYFAGEFQFLDLVVSGNSHVKIGYRALFLLNAIFFDLNTRYELTLGFLFLLGFVALWKIVGCHGDRRAGCVESLNLLRREKLNIFAEGEE
jgi:hypothetical protein